MNKEAEKTKTPKPGSDEAVKQGCTCPVGDNSRGKGWMGIEGVFWQNENCKLHGKEKVIMSDRFKFRAWDAELKEMVTENDVDMSVYQGELKACYIAGRAHPTLSQGEMINCVLMQCTGLKDKNGVLAFESDFIKSPMEGGHAIYPIEWDDEEKCLLWGGYALSRLADNGFEVVGNKFQNPELLELTND